MTERNNRNNGMYMRQLDFFNPDDYDEEVHVIGAGGIGSFVVVALAKLGLKPRVWDGDKVEDHNIPNQLHLTKAVGMPKVKALAALTKQLTGTNIKTFDKMWTKKDKLSGIVISAVDTMKVRQEIWDSIKADPKVKLYIDGRIGGETIRVLSIRPTQDIFQHKWYEDNLFSDKEGADLPCTARSIIDVGFFIATIITNHVRKFLKHDSIKHDVVASVEDLTLMKMEV